MKTIKINFIDFWSDFDAKKSLAYNILSKHYNVIISNNPDYIFFNYNSKNHFKYNDCIKIFFTGENIVPDFNICDYAIGFSNLIFSDRYIKMPLFLFYRDDIKRLKLKPKEIKCVPSEKTEFCSFVYSNSYASQKRIELFKEISKYKKINSGGKLLNNLEDKKNVENKYEFQNKHKFSIACENSSYPNYLTEKLLQSFAANTIPIYWGDPYVKEVFNEKAFINVADYKTYEELLEKIKEIDTNDALYVKILNEKTFCDDNYIDKMYKKYEDFLLNIFNQDKNDAIRKNKDLHSKQYQRTLKLGNIISRIIDNIYKMITFSK